MNVYFRSSISSTNDCYQIDGNNVASSQSNYTPAQILTCGGRKRRMPHHDIDKTIDRRQATGLFKVLVGLKPPGICEASKNLHSHICQHFIPTSVAILNTGVPTFSVNDIMASFPLRFIVKNYGLPLDYCTHLIEAISGILAYKILNLI
jgi:hypothetical protein